MAAAFARNKAYLALAGIVQILQPFRLKAAVLQQCLQMLANHGVAAATLGGNGYQFPGERHHGRVRIGPCMHSVLRFAARSGCLLRLKRITQAIAQKVNAKHC